MNSSYKIALLLAVVLCGVILGYYVTRDDPASPGEVTMADPLATTGSAQAGPSTSPSTGRLPQTTADTPGTASSGVGSTLPPTTGRSLLDSVNAHARQNDQTVPPVRPPVATDRPPGSPGSPGDAAAPPPAGVVTPPRNASSTAASADQPPTDARSILGQGPASAASTATADHPGPAVTDIPPNTGRRALRPTTPLTGRTYTIKENDTLSSIARKTMGRESYWQAIAEANPYLDPRRLKVGQVIRLPDPPQGASSESDAAAGGSSDSGQNGSTRLAGPVEYVVKSGDTLSRIARVHYGDPNLWEVIYRANRTLIGSDPAGIRPGMKLFIPPEPRTAH